MSNFRHFLQKISQKCKFLKKNHFLGFTMVEILVTITIIGILAALLFPSLEGLMASARDNERKTEITKLKVALQVYNTYNNKYPTTTDWISIGEDSSFSQTLDKKYIDALPTDPLYPQTDIAGEKYSYYYNATTSDAYTLCAKNESKGGYFCVDKSVNSGVAQVVAMEGLGGGGTGGGGGFVCGVSTVTSTYNGSSVTYGTVTSTNSECWLDRNLGASRVATTYNDSAAYGGLFQWGRLDDGHQIRNSGTTTAISTSSNPGHANFIKGTNSPHDWVTPQTNNLWQGVSGINNPCPSGWRIPTFAEWETEMTSWSSNNYNGAFASPLKLTAGGMRYTDALLYWVDSHGYYWDSEVSWEDACGLQLRNISASMVCGDRASAESVRCIKD